FGRRLVAVASQKLRFLTLIGTESDPDLKLTDESYCVLERVGRSRWQGELQRDLSNGTFKIESRKIHYLRKSLVQHNLVSVQSHVCRLNTGTQQHTCLLLLRRFHTSRRSKYDTLMERVSNTLEDSPGQQCTQMVLRQHLSADETNLKKIIHIMRSAKMVESFTVPLEELDPESGPCLNKRGNKVQVRCVKLLKPYSRKKVPEDDEDEEEEGSNLRPEGRIMERDVLSQAYDMVVSSGTRGLTCVAIGTKLNVGKLERRMICRKLEREGVIKGFMEDVGRQRTTKYLSHKCVEVSDKLHQFVKEHERSQLLCSSARPDSPKPPSATKALTNIDVCRLPAPSKYIPGQKKRARDRKISKGWSEEERPAQSTEEQREEPAAAAAEPGTAAEDDSTAPAQTEGVLTVVTDVNSPKTSTKIHETCRLLRRKNLIIEAIQDLRIFEGLFPLLKIINTEEKNQGFNTKCCKKTIRRLVQTLARKGLVKHYTTTVIQDGVTRKVDLYAHPSIQSSDEIVQRTIDQVRFKMSSTHSNARHRGDRDWPVQTAEDRKTKAAPKAKMDKFTPTTVYCEEDSWKKYVPPVKLHKDWGRGWAMLGDLIFCLPLSLFIQVIQVNYKVDGLEDYLNDPEKQHYLVRSLPSRMKRQLMYRRRYIYSFYDNLKKLVYMGLIQLGPLEKFRDKDQVFLFVKRHATIVDTTSSEPHYWLVSEPPEQPFERRKYTFDTSEDVESFWFDLIGSSEVVDDGSIPGDGKGAGGLSSEFFGHLKRNWLWTNHLLAVKPKQTGMEAQNTKVRLKSLCRNSLQMVLKAERSALSSYLTPKKKIITEVQVVEVPASRNKQVVGGKQQKRKRQKKEVVKAPRKKKEAPKKRSVPHDARDHEALKQMTRQRVYWSQQEDSLMMLCAVAAHLLNTKLKRPFVPYCVVRDILHKEFNMSRDKTSLAVGRRTRYILKNPQTLLNYRFKVSTIDSAPGCVVTDDIHAIVLHNLIQSTLVKKDSAHTETQRARTEETADSSDRVKKDSAHTETQSARTETQSASQKHRARAQRHRACLQRDSRLEWSGQKGQHVHRGDSRLEQPDKKNSAHTETPSAHTQEPAEAEDSSVDVSDMMPFTLEHPGGACVAAISLMSLGLLSVHLSIPKQMVVVDSTLVDRSTLDEEEEDEEEAEDTKKMEVKSHQASHTKYLMMKGYCSPGIVKQRNLSTTDSIVVESCGMRVQLRETPAHHTFSLDSEPALDLSLCGPSLLPRDLSLTLSSPPVTSDRCLAELQEHKGYSPQDVQACALLWDTLDRAGEKGLDVGEFKDRLRDLELARPPRTRTLQQYTQLGSPELPAAEREREQGEREEAEGGENWETGGARERGGGGDREGRERLEQGVEGREEGERGKKRRGEEGEKSRGGKQRGVREEGAGGEGRGGEDGERE
ncbi:hypothetical protein WMY93_006017, partial [Mugilogobius chulae]